MQQPVFMPQGPWTYSPHEYGAPVVGPEGRICDLDCIGYPDDATEEEMEAFDAERDAHGRLIAALPELFEACRLLCAWAEAETTEAEEIMTNALAMATSAMSKGQQGT